MLKVYFNNFKNIFLKRKIKKFFSFDIGKQIEKFEFLGGKKFVVSLRYVSSEEIKEINKNARGVDRKTDVLSFPIIDFNNVADVMAELENGDFLMLGDIIICKEVAKDQAKEYKHSYQREICFLALHGFLHLLGYDHIEKEDEKIMMSTAKEILEKFNIRR